MPWLIGGLLVAGLAAFLLGWAPLATCDSCRGERHWVHLRSWACECCGDRLRITYLKKWSWNRGTHERALEVDPDRY